MRNRAKHYRMVRNAFCPTGVGGGIDPTCSPSESADLSSVASMTKKEFADKYWFHGQDEDDVHFGKQEIHGGVTKSFTESAVYAGLVYGKTGGQVRIVPHSTLSPKQTKRIGTTGGGHKIIDSLKDAPVKSLSVSIPTTETDPHEYLVKRALASGVNVPDRVLKDYPHLRKLTTNARKKSKKRASPLRFDPTRTTTLRRAFVARLRRGFARLRLAVVDLIDRQDALGLREVRRVVGNAFCPTGEGGGVDPTCSPEGGGSSPVSSELRSKIWSKSYKEHGAGIPQRFEEAYGGGKWVKDRSDHKIVRSKYPQWGHSHSDSTQIAEASARILGIKNKYRDREIDPQTTRVAKAMLDAIHSDKIGSRENLYHGTSAPRDWVPPVVGSIINFPLTATTGQHDPGYGVSYDQLGRVERGEEKQRHAIIYHFPKGTPILGYAASSKEDAKDSGYKWEEAITAGKFRVGRISTQVESGWRNTVHTVYHLEYVGPASEGGMTHNERWRFHSDPDKLKQFQDWLKTQIKAFLVGMTEEELWTRYVEEGFKKGAGRAFEDVKPRVWGTPAQAEFYAGSKDQFLKSAFGRPESVSKVKLLASRSFDEMKGMTEDMTLKMGRALVDGLTQGKNPNDIARDLSNQIGVSRTRAETIARTEIIRAHAEGQLQAFEEMGVDEIGVMVEWTVTEDEALCPLCEAMQGVVLKIEEARGMIPRHPNAVFAGSTFVPYGECEEIVRAWYSGPSVVLSLRGGDHRTTIGPNHPVFTRRGMVRAAELRECDEVLYDTRGDVATPRLDLEQVKTVEDVFTSLHHILGDAGIVSTASDLHGDITYCQGKVEAIRPTRGLLPVLDSFGIEQFRENGFARTDTDLEGRSSLGAGDSSTQRILLTPSPFVSESSEFGGGELSKDHSHPLQSKFDRTSIDPVTLLKGAQTFTEEVPLPNFFKWERVHQVSFGKYEGWAFDATTATSLYYSGGLVVSNCRCAFIPANVGEATDDQTRGKSKIVQAVKISARMGNDGFSTAVPVSKVRPTAPVPVTTNVRRFSRLLRNVFCATGAGGGVDPSCSPGESFDQHGTTPEEAGNLWSDYGSGYSIKEISKGNEVKAGSTDINGNQIDSHDVEKYGRVAKAIQKVAQSNRSAHKEVWRGIAMPDGTDVSSMFPEGKEFTFDGLTATSHDKDIAKNYTDPQYIGERSATKVLIRINEKEGVRGYDNNHGELSGGETILPSGAKYKVQGIRREGDIHVVTMTNDATKTPRVTPVSKPKTTPLLSPNPSFPGVPDEHVEEIQRVAKELAGKKYTGKVPLYGRVNREVYKRSGKSINLSGYVVEAILKDAGMATNERFSSFPRSR